tara:strand:+ start:762 stop:1241 length:480 start_codon:yes stop_codon:yes gene_type:complete
MEETTNLPDWDPTKEDLLKVERLINKYQIEYDTLIQEKRTKEFDLSKIKSELRIGGYMKDEVYHQLCRNQKNLVTEIDALQPKINKVKAELRAKHLMKEEIRNHLDENSTVSDAVEKKIYELRDVYTEFAGDATRVSSTRIMASKFVEEMQGLIKLINA